MNEKTNKREQTKANWKVQNGVFYGTIPQDLNKLSHAKCSPAKNYNAYEKEKNNIAFV